MSDWTTTATLAAGCATVLFVGWLALGSRASQPLPPGPPGLPWLGTIFGVDAAAPFKTYAEWGKKYGDIVHTRLMGKDIIIINSEEVAKELLEKRSRIYSDRPYLISTDLRFFHQTFRLDAVARFWPLQHHKSCQFLQRLFKNPDQLEGHVFEYTAALILNSTYNYDPTSRKDELVDIAADTLNNILLTARPDIAIVTGAFPLLLHLPSWFPGMSFKKQMAIARTSAKMYLERPFKYALQRMLSGNVAPSMMNDALRHMEEKGISPEESWMEELKGASGTAFLAASETSSSVLMTFFLMMVSNPAVQEKAQVEIDAVVSKDRLPIPDDRPLLPYLDAIFWETLRYNPVLPLSLPHATVDDDVYDGYYIPKGAVVSANLWAMGHDESRFPNPHSFIPERYLNDDGSLKPNEIEHIAFGFGRRICVGRYFADWSVWAVIARTLAIFKILKALDENGVEIPVEPQFTNGVAIHPRPFKFRIEPRFPGMSPQKLERLIAATLA